MCWQNIKEMATGTTVNMAFYSYAWLALIFVCQPACTELQPAEPTLLTDSPALIAFFFGLPEHPPPPQSRTTLFFNDGYCYKTMFVPHPPTSPWQDKKNSRKGEGGGTTAMFLIITHFEKIKEYFFSPDPCLLSLCLKPTWHGWVTSWRLLLLDSLAHPLALPQG